jgi:hypothetical protein
MTVSKYQVSSKLPDGRIFVIGGDNFAEFKANLDSALGSVQMDCSPLWLVHSLVRLPISHKQLQT